MKQWYLRADGVQQGPLDVQEIEAVLRNRGSVSGVHVWRSGLGAWSEITAVPELFQATASALETASSSVPAAQAGSAGASALEHEVSICRWGPSMLLAHGPYDRVLYLVQAALGSCGFSVSKVDRQAGSIIARSGVSWKSWGEVIYVFFRTVPGGGIQITCRSKLKFGLYDWSKNRQNVERFYACLLSMSGGVPSVSPVPAVCSAVAPQAPKWYAEGKNRWVALGLSLLIVGLGQFYNGDTKKGLWMLLVAIVSGAFTFGILWFGMAIWSAIDAYLVASRKAEMWRPP